MCSIEAHNVALKWARQDCEANGSPEKVYHLGATIFIPPRIKPAPPAPPEAFQFLTEASPDQWTQWSPIWMLSKLRDEDRALVVCGPQLRQDYHVVSIECNVQRSTSICGRAANSAQDGPQLRLMQVGIWQSETLSLNSLTGREVGFTRHTAHSHSITARKIDRCLQFSHRKQAAAHGTIKAITKSLEIRKPTRN